MKKIALIIILLINFTGTAQRVKKTYLDSLARKIHFKGKRPVFFEGSLDAMKGIASYINKKDGYYLIECHTSSEGKEEDSQILTDKIAGMVQRIFVNLGVDSSKIVSIGKGELYPCCYTKTRATRYLNRRIKIKQITEEEIKNLKSKNKK